MIYSHIMNHSLSLLLSFPYPLTCMQVKILGLLIKKKKKKGSKGSLEPKPNQKHNRSAHELKLCSFIAGFINLDAIIETSISRDCFTLSTLFNTETSMLMWVLC